MIGTRPYHHTPLNNPPELTTEEVEVTDPTHPLCGRRFPILSDTRIADYSDTQLPPPQLSGPAGAGARETDPATPGSARLHRGDTAAPPRRDARAHGRRTSSHLRRKPRRRPTAPWSGGAGAESRRKTGGCLDAGGVFGAANRQRIAQSGASF